MVSIQVGQVVVKGPLFDGSIDVNLAAFMDEANQEVAYEGQQDVRSLGMSQYQHPTGYYKSRVLADRVSAEMSRVHDSMVVYGPWLEGVGSRNATTRFKGYRTWRLTRQTLEGKAPRIAARVLKRYMPRLGGK